MGNGIRRPTGGGGAPPDDIKDPRRAVLEGLKVGRNPDADRQVTNKALATVLAALPEDIQQQLADRQVALALPAIPGRRDTDGQQEGNWRFVVRPTQSLEQAAAETLRRQMNMDRKKDDPWVDPTPEQVAEVVKYAVDSVGGDAAHALAMGRVGGALAPTNYQTRMDTIVNMVDAAQENPELKAALSEYIGAPAAAPAVVAPVADAAVADVAWMAQRPGMLKEVPVLQNATNGQLAMAGTGIGGAGLAFLADYLMGGDERQPVTVVAPGGGYR
jgi:hypothetical protein